MRRLGQQLRQRDRWEIDRVRHAGIVVREPGLVDHSAFNRSVYRDGVLLQLLDGKVYHSRAARRLHACADGWTTIVLSSMAGIGRW